MNKAKSIAGLFGLLLLVSASGQAATITTLFAFNNGGDFGGAVYFDLTVGSNAITVTGFETNTAETVAFTWEVFITAPGSTRVGNETTAASWFSVATGSGTGAGVDVPTTVTLNNTFSLLSNTTYGVALVMGPTAGHDYTNGDGTNQAYSNADLSLSFGGASNVPFTGPVFDPRVWNGTIVYDVGAVPEPSTLTLLLLGAGLGLVGIRRRRKA